MIKICKFQVGNENLRIIKEFNTFLSIYNVTGFYYVFLLA
jgi:hypothetical protein